MKKDRSASRFMWWAPWKVTRPWLPRVFRGGDEWHNASIAVVIPPLGCFIWFYEPGFSRDGEEHVYALGADGSEGRIVEGCATCSEFVQFVDAWHLDSGEIGEAS